MRDFTCTHDGDYTHTVSSLDAEDAAEDYARWLYENCDGWEWMTPNKSTRVVVTDPDPDDGEDAVTEWDVDIEFEPTFSASKPRPPKSEVTP